MHRHHQIIINDLINYSSGGRQAARQREKQRNCATMTANKCKHDDYDYDDDVDQSANGARKIDWVGYRDVALIAMLTAQYTMQTADVQ